MKVAQSCLTLCNPMDYTIHGILQAKILERVAFPGDLPNTGIKPRSPALEADSLTSKPLGKPVMYIILRISGKKWAWYSLLKEWHCHRI